MAQNLVIPNKDNKVVFVFTGIDLTQSTDIVVDFGAESYSTTLNPTLVIVSSATELSLDLSSTAEVGKVFATVTYIDGASVNGTDITSQELGNSEKIVIAIGTQLVIEDGSIVADANSFATDAEFKAYSNIRNFDVPATQPGREALLVLAMDYLFSKEQEFKGGRVSAAQELPYPRRGVCANGFNIPSDAIPQSLKKAQMELAAQANESSLLISGTVQNLASFNVDGVYSESYFSGGNWEQVRTDRADAYLNSLLVNNGSSNLMIRV
jgi:hypothetical protein